MLQMAENVAIRRHCGSGYFMDHIIKDENHKTIRDRCSAERFKCLRMDNILFQRLDIIWEMAAGWMALRF